MTYAKLEALYKEFCEYTGASGEEAIYPMIVNLQSHIHALTVDQQQTLIKFSNEITDPEIKTWADLDRSLQLFSGGGLSQSSRLLCDHTQSSPPANIDSQVALPDRLTPADRTMLESFIGSDDAVWGEVTSNFNAAPPKCQANVKKNRINPEVIALANSPRKNMKIMMSEDKQLLHDTCYYFYHKKQYQDAYNCVYQLRLQIMDIREDGDEKSYWQPLLPLFIQLEKDIQDRQYHPEKYDQENLPPKNTGRPPRSPSNSPVGACKGIAMGSSSFFTEPPVADQRSATMQATASAHSSL